MDLLLQTSFEAATRNGQPRDPASVVKARQWEWVPFCAQTPVTADERVFEIEQNLFLASEYGPGVLRPWNCWMWAQS
jgi:hypothetical protein